MTDPRDHLGRMSQPFGDMHHEADRARRQAWIIARVTWALVGAVFTLVVIAMTLAARAYGAAQPPIW
jgi:heme/copper-type cytochrome/quinol oxidase subunit 2